MDFPKIILTSDENIFGGIIKKFDLNHIKTVDTVLTYEGYGENSKIFLIFSKDDINKATKYILDNYIYEKILYIGKAKKFGNIDLKPGDIILPNTFIDSIKGTNAIFIENNIGDNYDFKKFGLILSGICLSIENFDISDIRNFEADIVDNEVYSFVKIMSQSSNINNFQVVKIIESEDNNLIDIEELSEIAINFLL